jgi:hypothetical protein
MNDLQKLTLVLWLSLGLSLAIIMGPFPSGKHMPHYLGGSP